MDKQSSFAKDTELCASLLTGPQGVEEGSEVCILPSGEEVNFYQVIPLYRKQSSFAKDTELCASLLTGPQGVEEGSEVCILPSGEEVNFYQVIPLYRKELAYKLEHDADALIEQMAEISFVVHPDRPNSMEGRE